MKNKALARVLFRQAVSEGIEEAKEFVYSIAPENVDKLLERYSELCKENDLDPFPSEGVGNE